MTTRRALLGIGLLVMAGCSAAPLVDVTTTPSITPSPTSSIEGQTLTSMGLRYGPTNFALPPEVKPTRVIDQDNVVTMIFTPADGRLVHDHLANHLSAWGWTITASSEESLIFTQPGWEGATTISAQAAGLTLRVVPPS